MDDFLKKADEVLSELISSGDKVLVGVSGGADSIALIQVLKKFSLSQNYTLVIAHINHMARGKDSFKDAKFVKDVAKNLGLPFFYKEINVDDQRLRLKKTFKRLLDRFDINFLKKH